MRRVAVAATATSTFVKTTSDGVLQLASNTCADLIEANGLSDGVDALLLSTCVPEQYGSPILAEMLGLKPRICQRIDNLCNSGTNAVVTAYSLIACGLAESVLVAGADKRESPGNVLQWDACRGAFNLPAHWAALFARHHMRRYGTTEEQLAMVSVKSRQYSRMNPRALFRENISIDEVLSSRKIVDPLRLLECSAACDGAAAVLLVSEEKARSLEQPVWIKGIGQQTNSASLANATLDLSNFETSSAAASAAYSMAGTDASNIDVAEVHDAFSILEILAVEDLDLAPQGDGGRSIGSTHAVINPSGGILGRGHPAGATGVAQIAEISDQLTGRAMGHQVKGCRTGIVHNLAAAGSSATVVIMGTEK